MADLYDFIVVGGGTSGCVIASRLACAASAPRVLLLEAGGANSNPIFRSAQNRWPLIFAEPSMEWGYVSTPQTHLAGQKIRTPRGKGLGGTSAVNFACWVIGDKNDFEEWARLVGDDTWRWDGENGVKQRFRKIENLHLPGDGLTETQKPLVDVEALKLHSNEGKVDISWDQFWESREDFAIQGAKDLGIPLDGDTNDGNPRGLGLSPSAFYKGARTTSASAYLSSPPSNITIITDSIVDKIIFDDFKRAVGVITADGKIYNSSKEVVISSGTFDSPKILLRSGVGPGKELTELSVPVIYDLPGVGKNLMDHVLCNTTHLLKEGDLTEVVERVRDPLLSTSDQCPMAWLQLPGILDSAEFAALPETTKGHISKVPTTEIMFFAANLGVQVPRENAQLVNISIGVMNAQSKGTVSIISTDPRDPGQIDLQYLSHPFDRRVAIESMRKAMEFGQTPSVQAVTEAILSAPKSSSDEDIWEYIKKEVMPVFHFSGTCKMGTKEDESAVVDQAFRVRGVKGVRVVDLSVAPLMVNNHTQSTCYLIGETAAEKFIEEYGL